MLLDLPWQTIFVCKNRNNCNEIQLNMVEKIIGLNLWPA